MQFEQVDAATRLNLPKPSIDTGMGLERIAAVMQGVHDNYDIDLFRHLITASVELTGAKDQGDAHFSHRVIADHLRSSSFLIADGVLPSNEGRGYVLRRIMRRAMRHAHLIGSRDPLMYRLVPTLVAEMGRPIRTQTRRSVDHRNTAASKKNASASRSHVASNCSTKKRRCLATAPTLGGETAFKLYDTYGFPLDLTEDALKARGIAVTSGLQRRDGEAARRRAQSLGRVRRSCGRRAMVLDPRRTRADRIHRLRHRRSRRRDRRDDKGRASRHERDCGRNGF